MSEVTLEKRMDGSFVPATPQDVLLTKSIKIGSAITVKYSKIRNYQFLKKYMVLMHYAFDIYEPPVGEKNFDRFREEVTILSGYYTEVASLNGKVRVKADSISFGKMDEDTFAALYNTTCDVLLKWVLKNYKREDIDHVMKNIVEFAA